VATPFLSARGGQAALSFVFLVGAIIALIATSLAFLTISFVNSSFGFQASQRALAAASSGAADALMQLIRNKDFSDATGYGVSVGNGSATVTVSQNTPAIGQATIISTALVSIYQLRIRVIVSIHSLNGQVKVISWQRI